MCVAQSDGSACRTGSERAVGGAGFEGRGQGVADCSAAAFAY